MANIGEAITAAGYDHTGAIVRDEFLDDVMGRMVRVYPSEQSELALAASSVNSLLERLGIEPKDTDPAVFHFGVAAALMAVRAALIESDISVVSRSPDGWTERTVALHLGWNNASVISEELLITERSGEQ